jgi:hypothetical protein
MKFTEFVINALENDLTSAQRETLNAEVEFNERIDLIALQKKASRVRSEWVSELVKFAGGVLTEQGFENGVYTGITPILIESGEGSFAGISMVACKTAINLYQHANGKGHSTTLSGRMDSDVLEKVSTAIGFNCEKFTAQIKSLEDELNSNIARALIV